MKNLRAIALVLLLGSMTLVAQSAPASEPAKPAEQKHAMCKRDKNGKMECCKKNKDGKMSEMDCCKKGKCAREKKEAEKKS